MRKGHEDTVPFALIDIQADGGQTVDAPNGSCPKG